jgi:hypothetical protein
LHAVTVLTDAWRAHPLAWIHRAEARAVAAELGASGRAVTNARFRGRVPDTSGTLLLRLSDPVMLEAARMLGDAGIAYRGPSAAALARCYDKWAAIQAVAAGGIDCPRTRFATLASDLPRPLVLKPRRGSDSIGVRVLRFGAIPPRLRNERTLAQSQVFGAELTVGVINGTAGAPLRLGLPEGTPYTFLRKYLVRPGREVLADAALAQRARRGITRRFGARCGLGGARGLCPRARDRPPAVSRMRCRSADWRAIGVCRKPRGGWHAA